MTQEESRLPEEEIRVGGTITASIWRNETQRGDRTVANYSVQFQKRYFDKAEQEWRTSTSFFENDLPRIELAARKAYEYIMIKHNPSAENSAGNMV